MDKDYLMLIAGCVVLTQTWIEFICQIFSRFPSTKWEIPKYRQILPFMYVVWAK